MPSYTSKIVFSALAGAATVAAHGHVSNFVIDGNSYEGFNPFTFPYMSNPPAVAAWTDKATDNGFVSPSAFQSGDIICHNGATNAKAHAVVAAGDTIMLKWDTWPQSHHGPVIDYLANCGDSCETVDKTTLKFFKIDEVGLIDGSSGPGTWGSDQLMANNNSWLVTIPNSVAPGFYVLRHEIIALHSAYQDNGAQNYPQCINLQITGSGTDNPVGTLGQELYKANDAGIHFNIYTSMPTYPIPGPALYSGAVRVASQTQIPVTASTTAITGSATGVTKATTTAAAKTSAAATSSAAATTSAVAKANSGSSAASSAAAAMTSAVAKANSGSTTASKLTTTAKLETIATSAAKTTTTSAAAAKSTSAAQTTAYGGGYTSCSKTGRVHARDIAL